MNEPFREDVDQLMQRYGKKRDVRIQRKTSDHRRSAGRKHRGALDFTRLAADGNRFVNEVSEEIGCERPRAARILRAVLHALRDRLPADDSIQFAQGLPLVIKGVWLDQYDISDTPVTARSARAFIRLVEEKAGITLEDDFPTPRHTVFAIRGVFRVLENNMDMGQLDQVKWMLGDDTLEMIEGTGRI